MDPYRDNKDNRLPVFDNFPLDDGLGLGIVLSFIGGARVATAIATGQVWGGEVMIALVLLVLGLRETVFRRYGNLTNKGDLGALEG